MDRVPSVAAESSTRDLGAFNRWLCTSRLRAAGAVLVFGLTLRLLQPGIVALGPLLVVCGWLLGVSLVGFAVAAGTVRR